MKNNFYSKIQKAYKKNASIKELQELLGTGRAKRGMFEGDLIEGELEIGQVSCILNEIMSVDEIICQIVKDFEKAKKRVKDFQF